MKVEAIKKELLAEHNTLRTLLELVTDLAEKVATHDLSQEPALREAAHNLSDALVHHMVTEEKHLADLSRGGSPHWARHLDEFKHHHGHQRELLAHFLERVDNIHASRRLSEVVQAMATAVLLDIEHEEMALFAPQTAGLTSVQGA
ncbi:hemerythrin domain-containing protein [Hyalangium gracile]|uniref:hemerythrin domain-containing protein n=1 Tax=Hyalangium gracile TaxID=394092 RepID=UPI001CCD2623|nr:hemerythrin domain-containing protein [Hyalangium gracile]